jgi:hypothetical protein
MGFPTKVQLSFPAFQQRRVAERAQALALSIKRKASEQWYINFPSALAQAMDFSRGETVEWTVEDKSLLALRRLHPPAPTLKKTLPAGPGKARPVS